MKIISFPEQMVIFAKDQPEYLPLPAYLHRDQEGRITCCWQLSWSELFQLLFTRRIWHTVLTFGDTLQPQLLQIEKPNMPTITMDGR